MAKQQRKSDASKPSKGIAGFAGSASEDAPPSNASAMRAASVEPTKQPSNDAPSVGDDPGDSTPHPVVMAGDDTQSENSAIDRSEFQGVSAKSFAIPGLHAASETPPLADGSFSVANVVGADDRKEISNTQKYPFRAICSLLMTGNNGKQSIGTGWFAGPNLIVTAGHNLFDNDFIGQGWIAKAEIYPGRNGSSIPYSETAVQSQFGVSDAWLNRTSDRQQLDYGVIRLTSGLGNKVGWFGMKYWPSSELQGKEFNVVGYPQEAGPILPWTMWYDIGSITFAGQRTLQYKMDTTPGESGSPVVAWVDDRTAQGSMIVVGIHNYGLSNGLNEATRITPAVIETIQQLSS